MTRRSFTKLLGLAALFPMQSIASTFTPAHVSPEFKRELAKRIMKHAVITKTKSGDTVTLKITLPDNVTERELQYLRQEWSDSWVTDCSYGNCEKGELSCECYTGEGN